MVGDHDVNRLFLEEIQRLCPGTSSQYGIVFFPENAAHGLQYIFFIIDEQDFIGSFARWAEDECLRGYSSPP